MIIEIKELTPSDLCLVDLTNTELNEVKGGYLPLLYASVGLDRGAQVASDIAGYRRGTYTDETQRSYGVPGITIGTGNILADTLGGGRFNFRALAAKLQD